MKLDSRAWFLMAIAAIAIGLYPLFYLTQIAHEYGFLSTKSEIIKTNSYMIIFYAHIIAGGISLLVGWPQFKRSWRNKNIRLHRTLGRVFLVAVLFISGPSALYIAFFATGGIPSQFGFTFLGIAWMYSAYSAFTAIKRGDIEGHLKWMIRAYALTFAAVTLRIYLPLFTNIFGWEYVPAYQSIAWLCWVPNLIIAEWIVAKKFVVI